MCTWVKVLHTRAATQLSHVVLMTSQKIERRAK